MRRLLNRDPLFKTIYEVLGTLTLSLLITVDAEVWSCCTVSDSKLIVADELVTVRLMEATVNEPDAVDCAFDATTIIWPGVATLDVNVPADQPDPWVTIGVPNKAVL